MCMDGGHRSTDVTFVTDEDGLAIALRSREKRSAEVPASFAPLADLLDGVVPNPATTTFALLSHFASLRAVLCAEERELAEVQGMTLRAARLLRAAHAASTHARLEQAASGKVIANLRALEQWLKTEIVRHEGSWSVALLLDRRNAIIREHALVGTLSGDVTQTLRTMLRAVIDADASGVIIVCNLPGLHYPPSAFTDGARRLARALAALGVALHDYVVVAHGQPRSLRAERLL